MGVSSPNRVFNVHLMADFLNGYKIAPGARFSFNEAVGPRTAERGFLEGQAIENGLLVPSIGGGVCQVATTVFDAAINGGYAGQRAPQPQLLHRSLPDGPRRDGGRRRARLRLHEQHGPHRDRADLLHRPDADGAAPVGAAPPHDDDLRSRADELRRARASATSPIRSTRRPKHARRSRRIGERGFDVDRVAHGEGRRAARSIATYTFHSHYIPEDIVFNVGKGAKLPKGAALEAPRCRRTRPVRSRVNGTSATVRYVHAAPDGRASPRAP